MALLSFLDREKSIAHPGYSRWLVPPAALAIHLCIGRRMRSACSRFRCRSCWEYEIGVRRLDAAANRMDFFARDRDAGAFGGDVRKMAGGSGAAKSDVRVGGLFCAGILHFVLRSDVAINCGCIYLGYGVVGGIGLGLGYISPVSTLIKWFPDHPGLATGMAIMGFGGGAMIGSPLSIKLMAYFHTSSDVGVGKTFLVMGRFILY